ncbi:hypothetical protein CBM2637_A30037 [Cupriavidus taiwanensis]|nr:hypothetical protein CBM2637_A30037 [Cupriavidus taiwanensis]
MAQSGSATQPCHYSERPILVLLCIPVDAPTNGIRIHIRLREKRFDARAGCGEFHCYVANSHRAVADAYRFRLSGLLRKGNLQKRIRLDRRASERRQLANSLLVRLRHGVLFCKVHQCFDSTRIRQGGAVIFQAEDGIRDRDERRGADGL